MPIQLRLRLQQLQANLLTRQMLGLQRVSLCGIELVKHVFSHIRQQQT